MNIKFFVKSTTVNIDSYTIKDIPGSSGRLDVISRCILSAILDQNAFEKNIQIWIFLKAYGTFVFKPELFNYENFPKNEILLTDYFVKFLQKNSSNNILESNPLRLLKKSEMSIIDAIKYFRSLKYAIYILDENGKNFFKLRSSIQEKENILFIVGSQGGDFIDSKELLALKLPRISLGAQKYLASSVIRLLKLHLIAL
ncbi:MAG: hypothetical protein ACFFB0_04225 [Promethearchaeota archaeon]